MHDEITRRRDGNQQRIRRSFAIPQGAHKRKNAGNETRTKKYYTQIYNNNNNNNNNMKSQEAFTYASCEMVESKKVPLDGIFRIAF